ncbi:MAG: c-type cytochrome [Wenzhouxiangellaceae bacterium]
MNHEDTIFMKHFSWIILGLTGFTVVIIFLATAVHSSLVPSENPSREAKKLERIKPVAAVYAGETGMAAAAAAASAAPVAAAFDGSMDGSYIYQQVCAACHTLGAAGAPRLEAGEWTERLPKGADALVSSAINGIGVMPAKGGRTDLSDEQVRVTVEWMLEQVE